MNQVADAVFVLNLDRSPDRLAAVDAELRRHGIRYERLPAVDGKLLDTAQIRKVAPGFCSAFCTAGMLGCFLSHLNFGRTVVERGYDRAIILEDDVRIVDGYEDTLRAACADLPDDADILYCGCFTCGRQQPLEMVLQRLSGTTGRTEVIGEHLVRPAQTLGSHAYMVTAKGARAALQRLPRASTHLDWAISSLAGQLQVFAVRPQIAHQSDEASTLGGAHPHVLNAMASKFPYSSEDRDARTWAWTLSEPLCTLGHSYWVVDGWLLISLALAWWAPLCFAPLYVLELLASVMLTRTVPGYFVMVGALLALRLRGTGWEKLQRSFVKRRGRV